jgi:hypothetical protein
MPCDSYSGGCPDQVVCLRGRSNRQPLRVQEPRWCPPVPHSDQTGPSICCPASLPLHARPSRAASCVTSRALCQQVCNWASAPSINSQPTPMPTRLAALTHGAPPSASASISATTWCLGLPSVRRLYFAPVPKRSTVQWPMLLLSVAGCVSYYMSSTSPSHVRRLSIVTM